MRSAPIIENEAAYEAARIRRIQANKAKTGRANWFAAFEDAPLLNDWLFGYGEFEGGWSYDERCEKVYGTDYDGQPELLHVEHLRDENGYLRACSCKRIENPLSAYARSDFHGSMREAIDNWGGLTERQHLAVRASFERAKAKIAERAEQRAAQQAADATTCHIGKVGERRDFTLTVERSLSFEGQFGTTYINICRDGDGNIVVYKGSHGWERGETIRCKATIKAHDYREGVPQTIISRPKVAQQEEV